MLVCADILLQAETGPRTVATSRGTTRGCGPGGPMLRRDVNNRLVRRTPMADEEIFEEEAENQHSLR